MKPWNHLKIPLQAIKNCTQDFNERNFIGKGGYGRVYKGILSWADHVDQPVAVKRLDVTGFQGNKEFQIEMTTLSQHRHKNIITLVGFCDDSKEMILVYEYASHGSLDTYLRGTATSDGLSWPQRIKICIDVASALDYLHNHVAEKHRIIHRDIKSANVLLDENWNAKLSDFGLSRIGLANQNNTLVITNVAGTYGYCDPQYEKTGFLSKESDIYSFGVVLFEVLCGRLACVVTYNDERRFLHHLARICYKNGEIDKIVDERIRKDIRPRALRKFSGIAYQCLQENREERPAIAEVEFQLKESWKLQLEEGSSKKHELPIEIQEFLEPSLRILSSNSSSLKSSFPQKTIDSVPSAKGMVECIGLLKITVLEGKNLAIRDPLSSDPYVVLTLGRQKVKTSVKKRDLNPVWNEEFKFSVPQDFQAIKLKVFDHDAYFIDEKMGEAEIDIRPLITSAMAFEDVGILGDMQIGKRLKTKKSALLEDSIVNIIDGKVTQEVMLELQNVESGEIDLRLEYMPQSSRTRSE